MNICRAGHLNRLLLARLVPLHLHRMGLWSEAARLLDEGWEGWWTGFDLPVLTEVNAPPLSAVRLADRSRGHFPEGALFRAISRHSGPCREPYFRR